MPQVAIESIDMTYGDSTKSTHMSYVNACSSLLATANEMTWTPSAVDDVEEPNCGNVTDEPLRLRLCVMTAKCPEGGAQRAWKSTATEGYLEDSALIFQRHLLGSIPATVVATLQSIPRDVEVERLLLWLDSGLKAALVSCSIYDEIGGQDLSVTLQVIQELCSRSR